MTTIIEDAGDKVVALIWSLSNQDNNIPYRITLDGNKMACTCPAFIYQGKRSCKHIKLLKESVKNGTVDQQENVNLTVLGHQKFGV